jgi:hypothetical protein
MSSHERDVLTMLNNAGAVLARQRKHKIFRFPDGCINEGTQFHWEINGVHVSKVARDTNGGGKDYVRLPDLMRRSATGIRRHGWIVEPAKLERAIKKQRDEFHAKRVASDAAAAPTDTEQMSMAQTVGGDVSMVTMVPESELAAFRSETCATGKTCFPSIDAIREHFSEKSDDPCGTFSAFNCRTCGYMHLDKRQDRNRPASQPAEAVA